MADARAVRLGFVPLNDAAALIAAKQIGAFAEEGLKVDLFREVSWATVRDKLAAGVLDGAHILAPLALAITAGIGCQATPLVAPFVLNIGGAAISVSTRLNSLLREDGLADLVARRQEQGASRLTFASVFPFSVHEYLLREWIAHAGLDPDRDVRLTVTAPSRAADLLSEGVIEGFCAGEPWNAYAVSRNVAQIALRVGDILPPTADKLLALRGEWAAENDREVSALVRALDRASAWSTAPENRSALATLLAEPDAIGLEAALIEVGLAAVEFHGGDVNRPDSAHGEWFLGQMRRWSQIKASEGVAPRAASLFRPDLYDHALGGAGA